MCYYYQTRWRCGYWRWGKFRMQCNKEYRIGETCGLKLMYERHDVASKCKLCGEMERKRRRYDKMARDVERWRNMPDRKATLEKTLEIMDEVYAHLFRMQSEHDVRRGSLV